MSRREFPARIKVAAFERAKGSCEGCGSHLTVGKYAYDHDNPDGLTGAPTLENCKVLCTVCHSEKTKRDVADIAQAKRRQAAFVGAKAKTSRPIPGSRASGIKKFMDGRVVRRNRGDHA